MIIRNLPENLDEKLLNKLVEQAVIIGKNKHILNKAEEKRINAFNNSHLRFFEKEPLLVYSSYVIAWYERFGEQGKGQPLEIKEYFMLDKARYFGMVKLDEFIENYTKNYKNFPEEIQKTIQRQMDDLYALGNIYNESENKTAKSLHFSPLLGSPNHKESWVGVLSKEFVVEKLQFIQNQLEDNKRLLLTKEELKATEEALIALTKMVDGITGKAEPDLRISEEDLLKLLKAEKIKKSILEYDDCEEEIRWKSKLEGYGVENSERLLDHYREAYHAYEPIVLKHGYKIDGEVVDNMAFIKIWREY